MKELSPCKSCGKPRDKGRRLCKSCRKIDARSRSLERYYSNSDKRIRTRYNHTCCACGLYFESCRKTTEKCEVCRKHWLASVGNYEYSSDAKGRLIWKHRVLAETLLKRRLQTNETVHHIDLNRSNSSLNNLMILSSGDHSSLHHHLNFYFGNNRPPDEVLISHTISWLDSKGKKYLILTQCERAENGKPE